MINFKKLAFAGALGAFLIGATTTAQASSYTINNEASGYISSGGNFTGIRPNTNYLVGLCDAADCIASPGEYRNFFYFAIPTLDGAITSASLVIPTRNTTLNQSPTLTFQLTSLGISEESLGIGNFSDLGTGTVYGSRVYSAADASTTQSIALNAAALSALGSGGFTFGLSGIATAPIDLDINAPDQLLFGRSQNQITQLVVTTVPVPPALGMLLLGFAGLRFAGFRGSKKAPRCQLIATN
jgi:hypothetical protein